MADSMKEFRELLVAARRAAPDSTSLRSAAVTMFAIGSAIAAEDGLSVDDLIEAVRDIYAEPMHSVRQTARIALAELRSHLASTLEEAPPGSPFTVVRLPRGGIKS